MPRHLRPVPPTAMSKKRAAFKKVAEPRLSNAVHAIQILGQCADLQRYEILGSDIETIRHDLTEAVKDTIARFETGQRKPVVVF
jgi:hypothetical protein